MAQLSRPLFFLSFVLALCANILVLCGIAGLQNVCHTDGQAITSTNICSKSYRFEWYVMGLEFVFLLLVAVNYIAKKTKSTGTIAIGATATVLATILANLFLTAVDAIRGTPDNGKVFSRTTLLFVGFMLVATFNYIAILLSDAACCGEVATPKPAAAAEEPAKPAAPSATVTTV